MAIVEEPCNVNAHADILALFMTTAVCTHVLYTLIVTVQLSFLSDRSEHRIHPGDTTTHHTPHTTHTPHTQSQMLSSGSPTKKLKQGVLEDWGMLPQPQGAAEGAPQASTSMEPNSVELSPPPPTFDC